MGCNIFLRILMGYGGFSVIKHSLKDINIDINQMTISSCVKDLSSNKKQSCLYYFNFKKQYSPSV